MPLSKPAIIGIVAAAIAFVILLIVLIVVLTRKKTTPPVLNVNGIWMITAGDNNLISQSISVDDSGASTIIVTLPSAANIPQLQMSVPSRVISNLVATYNGPAGSYTFNTTNGSVATFSGTTASQSAVNYTLKK